MDIVKLAKTFGPSAVLAVAGVKASEMFGATKAWQQVGLAIAGAFTGLFIASKF